ncbi:hypothetical protein MHBO_003240, partial [Bonamia ostreae]
MDVLEDDENFNDSHLQLNRSKPLTNLKPNPDFDIDILKTSFIDTKMARQRFQNFGKIQRPEIDLEERPKFTDLDKSKKIVVMKPRTRNKENKKSSNKRSLLDKN